MIEKGIMTTEAVDRLAEIYENEVGPQLGAAVVAKAWTDPEFKARLLAERHRRRAPSWASAACRARTWSSSRTPTPCTT